MDEISPCASLHGKYSDDMVIMFRDKDPQEFVIRQQQ